MITAPVIDQNSSAPQAEQGPGMMLRLNQSFETFIGITEELKGAYDKLRERADRMDRRLESLLQSLPSPVVAVDETGEVILFNRAAEEMMGLSSKEVMGARLQGIASLEHVLLLCQDQENWPRGGAGEERMVVDGKGRRRVVSSRMAELKDAQSEPAGRIEILNDHTETDRLRREVHRLDTLAAMGEMAANVAHQIRNPLNGVEGFASLLQRSLQQTGGEPTKDAGRYARNVVQGVREVNAIINGMLMLARGDRLEVRAVNLDLLMAEVVENLRTTLGRMGLDAKIEFRPGMGDSQVSCDWMKLKQACLNLGHNALEALAASSRRTLRVSTRFMGDQAVIRVTDTGPGMDRETAAKVFRPFFTTRDRGTGLGLSLAYKLVDLHGGDLTVRSVVGVGTVFKILLKGRQSGGLNGDQHDRACARCG